MREILFRGKGNHYGKWVEGFYTPISTGHGMKDAIITGTDRNCSIPTLVIPETIGQYTGVTDKNGKKIFDDEGCRMKSSIATPDNPNARKKMRYPCSKCNVEELQR